MEYRIPDTVLKYADMSFAAARDKIEEGSEIALANVRAQLASKGLAHSSVMEREVADLKMRDMRALLEARGNALIEAYELHGSLDEIAGKAILEELTKLRDKTVAGLGSTATGEAKMQAWRTRASGSAAIAGAQHFTRRMDKSSSAVLNEIGCEIERRRLRPRTEANSFKSHSALAAVRPVGEYAYHPEIQRVSQRLCEEGNFRQAILDALIHVIHVVREKTGLPFDGDDLMNRAFSTDNRVPPVRFNKLQTEGDKNEQRGFWYLFKGIVGVRNSKAHFVGDFSDPSQAHEYLALASLLMRLLDAATIENPSVTSDVPK